MKHYKLDIKTKDHVLKLIQDYKNAKPLELVFDDETDGLNIKHNNPFLIGFGFTTNDTEKIYTYTLDYELAEKQIVIDTMYVLSKIRKTVKKIIGHHIIFDLHMQANIGYPFEEWDKFTDTQYYIRLAHDAKIPKEGGAPLALKDYVKRYINPNARYFERKLKDEISYKKKQATAQLKHLLKGHPLPPGYQGKAKSWTIEVVDKFMKDKINELYELPAETAVIIRKWQRETPDPENYRLLNRENVTEYLHYDIIFTMQIYLRLKNVIIERGQEATLEREERALRSFYNLERNGIHFNYEKAVINKEKMRNYIIGLRNELETIAGQPVRVGQHEVIRQILYTKFDLNFANTEKDTLELIFEMDNVSQDAVRMIEIISELRSLEKWYSTYLVSWIEECEAYGNIVYPTYHQVGTVTGRVSSAFQQFPKQGKYTIDGEYLFHPRELFTPPAGKKFIYFDYSAMEMRILAIFTLLIKHPDINLVRAFQPYKCYRLDFMNNRISFNIKEKNWEQYDWYQEEDDVLWKATDIHSLTAKNAFNVTEEHPDFFTYYRPHGKTTNFSIVYGATPKTIQKKQRVTMQQAQALYNSYFKTYPGVKAYNEYVRIHIGHYMYAQNLFGRRYYGSNAHKSKNYLIQGTGADYTKSLLPLIEEYIRDKDIQLQGYLHDEFSFTANEDVPEEHILKIKEIMESLEVPITLTVDVEESAVSWKDKEAYAFKSI